MITWHVETQLFQQKELGNWQRSFLCDHMLCYVWFIFEGDTVILMCAQHVLLGVCVCLFSFWFILLCFMSSVVPQKEKRTSTDTSLGTKFGAGAPACKVYSKEIVAGKTESLMLGIEFQFFLGNHMMRRVVSGSTTRVRFQIMELK